MSVDLSQLEQAWLAAETIADEARQQALELSEELAKRTGGAATEAPEVSLLASRVAQLKARQEEAERTASDAFDRFWSAQSSGTGNGAGAGGSAYA